MRIRAWVHVFVLMWLFLPGKVVADEANVEVLAPVSVEVEKQILKEVEAANWSESSRLCLDWSQNADLTIQESPVLKPCIRALTHSGLYSEVIQWGGACKGEAKTLHRPVMSAFLTAVDLDILSLNAELQNVPTGEKTCILRSIGMAYIEGKQCDPAYMIALELSSVDQEQGAKLWRGARTCLVEADGRPAKVALLAPLMDRQYARDLGPVFRGFQLSSSLLREGRPPVLDMGLLAVDGFRELLQSIWEGKVGALIVAVSASTDMKRLKEIAELTGCPMGVVPVGKGEVPVFNKESAGIFDLRLQEETLAETLLREAKTHFQVDRTLVMTAREEWGPKVLSLCDSLGIKGLSLRAPLDVREEKGWIERDYRTWANSCGGKKVCAVMLDMDIKSAIHLLPYLELNGPPICAKGAEKGCIMVLGRGDWHIGRGGDRSGRRTDGVLFAVDFDPSSPHQTVKNFVAQFEETYSRVPMEVEALVFGLSDLLNAMLAGHEDGGAVPQNWETTFGAIGPMDSVLGSLDWSPEKGVERTPFLMTMSGDSPIYWKPPSPDHDELPLEAPLE